jgi:hypothetical protein
MNNGDWRNIDGSIQAATVIRGSIDVALSCQRPGGQQVDYIDDSEVTGDSHLDRWTVEAAVNFERTGSLACDIMLSWLTEFATEFPDATPPKVADGAEFNGWAAIQPPPSFQISPIPLELALPQKDNECPVRELMPWWDQLALRPDGSVPLRSLLGEKIGFQRLPRQGGWRPQLSSEAVSSRVDVFDSRIEARATLKFDRRRIKEAGFFGTLVPGFAELKDLASTASTVSEYVEVGCRVDLDTISAITAGGKYSTVTPFFNSRIKALIRERGYGDCLVYIVGVELTDGWRPLKLTLVLGYTKADEVDAAELFAQQLITQIATRRVGLPWVSAADADALREIASQELAFVETADKDSLNRSARCELPAARPISIAVQAAG